MEIENGSSCLAGCVDLEKLVNQAAEYRSLGVREEIWAGDKNLEHLGYRY